MAVAQTTKRRSRAVRLAVVALCLVLAGGLSTVTGYQWHDGGLHSREKPRFETTARFLVSEMPIFQSYAVRPVETGQEVVRGLQASQLAGTIPYVLTGDEMMSSIAKTASVDRSSFEMTAYRRTVAPNVDQGAAVAQDNTLPVVEVKVVAGSSRVASAVASAAVEAAITYAGGQQTKAQVPPEQRMTISSLGAPSVPKSTSQSLLPLQGLVFVMTFATAGAIFFGVSRRRADREHTVTSGVVDLTSVTPLDVTTAEHPLPQPG